MLDVCHVQTLSRIWHSFDSNGLFSGGFACRTLQCKCMTVHKTTFVTWRQTKLVSFIVKTDTLYFPQYISLDSSVPLNPELFSGTFCPCFVYSLRGDITCSCLQLAELFPVAVLKFYSPSLKSVFSRWPNIEAPLYTVWAQCNSTCAAQNGNFINFKTQSWKKLQDLKWSIWFSLRGGQKFRTKAQPLWLHELYSFSDCGMRWGNCII